MDRATAKLMSSLTGDFYRQVGESFSATRSGAWPGWERVLSFLEPGDVKDLHILDVACGNLRFEKTLFERHPGARVLALDGDAELAATNDPRIRFVCLDLAEALLEDNGITELIGTPACDAAVCLAFMHHLPLREQRERLMSELVSSVCAGGVVAVSFWQFADDERLAAKAKAATEVARERYDLSGLGHNDWLMGWQNRSDVFRFCHHCDDSEVDELAAGMATRADVIADYKDDGASGLLNRYVVLRRRA